MLEVPEEIPFKADQCIEFIDRMDVATALISAFERREAWNKIFNIAGGKTWQMTGKEYINRIYGALGVSVKAKYSREFTWLDWYDTARSNVILNYQHITFERFLRDSSKTAEELF